MALILQLSSGFSFCLIMPEPSHDTPPPSTDDHDAGRGRQAEHPAEIPAPGWRDILLRTKDEVADDQLSFVAAGGSFYLMLALIPGLAAAISVYGLIADPGDSERQFAALSGVMPSAVRETLTLEMRRISAESGLASLGAILGFALVLWSGSKGMLSLIEAMNIVFEERERRGIVHRYGLALLMTLGATVILALAVAIIGAVPGVLEFFGIGRLGALAVSAGRWVVLVAVALLALSVLYRYGPCRQKAKWRWVSWGAVAAAVLWLAASFLFSLYVERFANYSKTYGSLGAVVALMMWLYVSAYVVLLGGELNAEIEHQTARDSTTGAPAPMGSRGARMADTVGPSPGRGN